MVVHHHANVNILGFCRRHGNVATQLANGMVGENQRKVQFATILRLLQQGGPMQEYETIKLLYEFLAMPKNSKKHLSDSFGWTMVKFMHLELMRVTKAIMGAIQYVVINCDEVFIINNQSWLFVHSDVVQNWVRILILIFLDKMLEGFYSAYLTKVIMEALTIGGGLLRYHIAQKPICFGADGVNVF
jgi:hypothetical protein